MRHNEQKQGMELSKPRVVPEAPGQPESTDHHYQQCPQPNTGTGTLVGLQMIWTSSIAAFRDGLSIALTALRSQP